MKIERTVRLVPVQEHGHGNDRDMGQQQGNDHVDQGRLKTLKNIRSASTQREDTSGWVGAV